MAIHGWPEPPDLAGRPLDTAILLNRDYQLLIHNRLNLAPDRQEPHVPFNVLISFLSNTECLIDVLCERNEIQRTTINTIPNIPPGPSTTALGWPKAPILHDRLLDTALLLSRDYSNQLRNYIEADHNKPPAAGIPTGIWVPFSRNMEILVKALCQHGKLKLNSLASMPKIKDAPNRPREPRLNLEDARREFAEPVAASSGAFEPEKAEEPFYPKSPKDNAEKVLNRRSNPLIAVSNTGSNGARIKRHQIKSTEPTKSSEPTSRLSPLSLPCPNSLQLSGGTALQRFS